MSTIRWVDLLSSESNLSHSVANNEDVVEKAKKKKFPYHQERDLNSSFLNSYTADLDNSNVGINLKIKNMSIVEKTEKGENKPLLSADKTSGQMTPWRNDNQMERTLPSVAPDGAIKHTGEGQSEKSTEGVPPKDSKNVHSNEDEQTDLLPNVVVKDVIKEKNCVSEELVSPSQGELNQQEKSIPKVDSASEPTNGNTVLERTNKTGKEYPNAENTPEEEDTKKELLRRVSAGSENSQSAIEGAKRGSEKRQSDGKKRNSSNVSALTKGNRSNRIKNVSVDKESIQNSYFARYIVNKGGDSTKTAKNAKNGNTANFANTDNAANAASTVAGGNVPGCSLIMKAPNQREEAEVSKGTPHKGKKRKDRAVLGENSTASKFNFTLSHDVTVDDNNVPLNPAKKVKSRLKQRGAAQKDAEKDAEKEAANVAITEGTNVVPAPPGKTLPDRATKVLTKSPIADATELAKQHNNNLGIMEDMPNMRTPQKSHIPAPSHYKHRTSDNIDMEKFRNFDANFINYLGDIRSHFSDPFVNSNSNRVNSRLKEIAVGKSTKEYKNYVKVVKYEERMDDDPRTPNAYENVTNAKFQAKYNLWRKKLHKFDSIG
ncbi:hypothetical protein C922_01710 [Plasmodium inui San Antonio 1]|uniref:Histone RNA hairpin-binding protein RNA-binding domain-containing protein n=1 Tax=Plasmodium inui San Antonio 1 TaxID=1237626 RepID=W7AA11_9APIC|nr:hypothetical protein C922_01710 [Plasmodium inui San Antonio 1]EUD68098.1 hypothetical protein C922_01710 [Plasmodium inui San Antonio 1]